MRLSDYYRTVIKTEAEKLFGKNVQVFLFGSRVDETKKGGDIDLYIVTEHKENLLAQRLLFLARLKKQLGEQKIDVVFNEDATRLIEQEAKKWAIPI